MDLIPGGKLLCISTKLVDSIFDYIVIIVKAFLLPFPLSTQFFFFFFAGADVPVTNRNREEYVRLYIEYTLDVSIGPQFDAFQKGK